ncbi:MAG: 30S ribosomal protein S18 [Tenericutes bacterium 4572_104]|nr:MAG: 30S ribosomal protein S18 [Tenericutes bacterium 4572_104]
MLYDKKRKYGKKKYCRFCKNRDIEINYKNSDVLKQFVSDVGKIEPARLTGTCAKHQRKLSNEIKKARHMALMPYIAD